jgi:four helix bundle protein
MKIERFEDLKVWQYSRTLVTDIYILTKGPSFNKDYGLKDQIQRASVSIMNNIAEGFERDNNKEFIRFLIYSKGSAGEVR